MINKDAVNNYIKIEDLMDEFDMKYISLSGKFTRKCICPNPDHIEKTPSCYINGHSNDFYCYGCGTVGKAVDFYMMCKKIGFYEALCDLSIRMPEGYNDSQYVKKENNFEILLNISNELRKYIYNNPNKLDRSMKLCKKIDSIICQMDRHDTKNAKRLLEQVKEHLGS